MSDPGYYCCLHPDCDHAPEQVFNGGEGGSVMSGYKAGYSEARSPYYAAGKADGANDAAQLAAEKDPAGPDPEKAGSAMYMRGYRDGLGGGGA